MTSCRWTFEFWSLKAVVAGGIVIRLWTSWRTAEAAARTLNQLRNAMFGKRTQGFETSRFPIHATVVLMQGLYRSTVAPTTPAPLTHVESSRWSPKNVNIARGSGFTRPWLITE